jgi:hypothetical protein
MASDPGTPTRIHDDQAGDLEFWARLLDEHPNEIRRAIQHTGPDPTAVRSFLFDRQLGLDFDARPADVAARPATHPAA